MILELPSQELRIPRSTIVHIQQPDSFASCDNSTKTRIVTAYKHTSCSPNIHNHRSCSPPLPPPPPPQHHRERTPEFSLSTSSTPKRVITTAFPINKKSENNFNINLAKNMQSFASTRSTVCDSHSIHNDKPQCNIFRTETFRKGIVKECDERHSCDKVLNFTKSRHIFLSQVLFMLQIAITICVFDYKESDKIATYIVSYEHLIFGYIAYLLISSIILLLLLRCYNCNEDENDVRDIQVEHTALLIGITSLGVMQLIQIGLDVAQCIDNEFVLLPVLHFIFTLFLMHFLLTKAAHSKYLGFNNIALSHILSAQISLWIISLDFSYESCSFNSYIKNMTSLELNPKTKHIFLPPSIANLMLPIIHNYKLLTAFIVLTMWFTNNQPKINFIRAKLSDEEAMRAALLARNPSIKGFFIGLLILSTAFIILLLDDKLLKVITHTLIQAISAVVSLIGLLLRRNREYNNIKYQINLLDYHFIIYVTLFASYVFGFANILHNVNTKHYDIGIVINSVMIIIQITLQTFLMRLQGKKLVKMDQVFALLILTNLSLWILDISDIANAMSNINAITNFSTILWLFVSLNRFYASLMFFQFWKTK